MRCFGSYITFAMSIQRGFLTNEWVDIRWNDSPTRWQRVALLFEQGLPVFRSMTVRLNMAAFSTAKWNVEISIFGNEKFKQCSFRG